MRFVIIRKADADTEAGALPTRELVSDMLAYNDELAKAGLLRGGDGLRPSSTGVRVSFENGTPTITDGPFAEAKELVAGFTIIEAASQEEALEWVRRWPVSDGRGNVQLELRQLVEPEDFGPEFAEELRRHYEQHLRSEPAPS